MSKRIVRSKNEPAREGLSTDELWHGSDNGLIWCWERGRQKRLEDPELASRAEHGQLPILAWKGGVEKKGKLEHKPGSFQYLATWQGLRNEALNIPLDAEQVIVCSRTHQAVLFSSTIPVMEEET